MVKNRIPAALLEKIKEAVKLTDVVGEHVVLRKTGANWVGLCPFHSERTPSFSVSETKQLYHCYGCKKGGDLFGFVMDVHGLSFPEAVEELAERARIALPKDWSGSDSGDPETEKRRAAAREKLALAHKLNRFVAAFYHQNLSRLPAILEYVRGRGVDQDLERRFYVGMAPPGWDALAEHLASKKAPLPLAVELGLIRPSQKGSHAGSGYFDLFRNRVMFPILDLRGKVSGFGGRIMNNGDKEKDEGPKYLNSPESFIFQKSKLAFGLYQASKHIREKDEVVIVEGYFDVLALHAAGFQNVVATCGTALSADHLTVFKRFGSRITVLFDGDQAGVSATLRAMEAGLGQGLVLHGAAMPDGLDPDEVVLKPGGREKMAEILGKAQPLIDQRIAEEIRAASSGPEARTQALKRIGGWLGRFQDPIGRAVRLQTAAHELGVSQDLLLRAMGAGSGSPQGRSARQEVMKPSAQAAPGRPVRGSGLPQPGRGAPKLSNGDRIILQGLALGAGFGRILDEARSDLPPGMSILELFDYPPASAFLASLLEQPGIFGPGKALQERVSEYLRGDCDPQVRSILSEALVSEGAPEGSGPRLTIEEFRVAVDRGRARIWARFSQQIIAALAGAEAKKDAGLQSRLMKEYLDVQRKMKEFTSFYDEA